MGKSKNLNVVISHDWIEKFGGAEKVLHQFLDVFPSAEVVTLWQDSDTQKDFPKVQQLIHGLDCLRKRKAFLVPFMPLIWRRYKLKESTDFVLCSSHLFSHFVPNQTRNSRKVPKYTYVHTPARYIWVPELDSRGRSIFVRLVSHFLKKLDRKMATESLSIAANSMYIRERILTSWGLDSVVIYPPVDTAFFNQFANMNNSQLEKLLGIKPGFVLAASRFVEYKQLDLVIRAAAIAKKRLVIAGQGPEEQRLKKLASDLGSEVIFEIAPDKPRLGALYAAASVFVFPAVEDFGIMPVEAMASGTPVIVNAEGGASESLIEGKTGLTFKNGDMSSLAEALAKCEPFTKSSCVERAEMFGEKRFRGEIIDWLKN